MKEWQQDACLVAGLSMGLCGVLMLSDGFWELSLIVLAIAAAFGIVLAVACLRD